MPTITPPQVISTPLPKATTTGRAAVQAACTVELLTGAFNVTGWAHAALERDKLATLRDAYEATHCPGMARVVRGAVVARHLAQVVTGPLDYLVGTGKAAPAAPGVRDLFKLMRRGNEPGAHADRQAFLSLQHAHDTAHPANIGIGGDILTTERRIRTRVGAAALGVVAGGLGALGWSLARLAGRSSGTLGEAASNAAVRGACLGAAIATASMVISVSFAIQQGARLGTAALKVAITGVGLLGGALDLAVASAWDACIGPPRVEEPQTAPALSADRLPPGSEAGDSASDAASDYHSVSDAEADSAPSPEEAIPARAEPPKPWGVSRLWGWSPWRSQAA